MKIPLRTNILFMILFFCSIIHAEPTNSPGRRSIESPGRVQYIPTQQGRHRIAFDGPGELSFDSSRVRTDHVAKDARARLSKKGKDSVFGMAMSVDKRAASPKDFPSPYQSFRMKGSVFHFEPEGLQFDEPATLTIPYAYDGRGDESDITIYCYNRGLGRWEYLHKVSQDIDAKTVTARISHFSDYVAGMSSFETDEAGTLGGGNGLKQDVDPYLGTLVLKNTEFSVQARGLPLSLRTRFSSDYFYYSSGKIYAFNQAASVAGQTFVPIPKYGADYIASTGWLYELPSCNYSQFISAEGKAFDIWSCCSEWSSMKVGLETNLFDRFRVKKPTSTCMQLLIPEVGSSIVMTMAQENSVSPSKIEVYFPDGSRGEFNCTAGRIERLYDASGKNSLAFTYRNNKLESIAHSDGRWVKMLTYTDSHNKDWVCYILSENGDIAKLSAGDQFLSRRAVSKAGTSADECYESLDTRTVPDGATWAGLATDQKEALFSVLRRTEYRYGISSSVDGDTITVVEPGSGIRTYAFGRSFSSEYSTSTDGDGVGFTQWGGYYQVCHNKPKVVSLSSKASSDSVSENRIVYSYACPAGSLFNSNSRNVVIPGSGNHKAWDTNPSWSALTYSSLRNGAMLPITRNETIQYSYVNGEYQGVNCDETTYTTDESGGATKCLSKTSRSFTAAIYKTYYPCVEAFYVEDGASSRYTLTYSYDGYGREVAVKDTRLGNSGNCSCTCYSFPYSPTVVESLIIKVIQSSRWNFGNIAIPSSGPSIDPVFAPLPTPPAGRDVYSAFGAVAATALMKAVGAIQTHYTYDSLMNVVSRKVLDKLAGSSSILERTTSFEYDPTTNSLRKITYPNGSAIDLSYGSGFKSSFVAQDKRLLGTNTNGATNEYAVNVFDYDLRGRTTSATSKLINGSGLDIVNEAFPIARTTYAYDGCDRVTFKSRTANGATTVLYARKYDDAALTVTTTDAKGYMVVDSFDEFYRRTWTMSYRPDTADRDASYNGSERVAVSGGSWAYDVVYPQNVVEERTFADTAGTNYYQKTYTYDAAGRLATVCAGTNSVASVPIKSIEYSFSQDGTRVVEKNYRTASEYTQAETLTDWLGRKTSMKTYPEANGVGAAQTTSCTYDYTGERLTQTLQNGEVYSYAYALSGLLEAITYPANRGTQKNEYDLSGRLIKTTDVAGNAQTFSYNGAGFVTRRIGSASGKNTITINTTFCQYGPLTVTQVNSGLTTAYELKISYSYGEDGRVRKETREFYDTNGTLQTISVSHAYDAAGNLATLKADNGTDFSKAFTYSMPYFGGAIGTNPSTSVSFNGTTIARLSRQYCGANDQLNYGSGLTTYFTNYDSFMRPQAIINPNSSVSQSYTYDHLGNATTWNTTSFSYDGMNRLLADGTGSYSYDSIGNIKTAPGNTSYAYITTTSSTPTMRLDSSAVDGVTRDYSDDGNIGNTTAVGGKYADLKYDAFNRLCSITDIKRSSSPLIDEYFYDPSGLRYKKIERKSAGTQVETHYFYEGNNILVELVKMNGVWTKRFNAFIGGMNFARVSTTDGSTSIRYLYLDHLGSVRMVTDSSGTPLAKIDYSTWGMPTVSNYNGYDGTSSISYTGKKQDLTGLYYFNARYYDPSIGRFISEDPVRDGLNWYSYCGNNPVSFTDPTGLTKIDDGPSIQDEEVPKSTPEEQKEAEKRMDDAGNQLEEQTRQAEKTILVIARARELANLGRTWNQSNCSASASNIYQTPLLSSGGLSYDPITGKYYEQISPDEYEAGDMYVVRYDLPNDHEGVLGHCQINLGNGEYFDSIPDTGPRISGNPTSAFLQDKNALFCSEVYLRPREF